MRQKRFFVSSEMRVSLNVLIHTYTRTEKVPCPSNKLLLRLYIFILLNIINCISQINWFAPEINFQDFWEFSELNWKTFFTFVVYCLLTNYYCFLSFVVGFFLYKNTLSGSSLQIQIFTQFRLMVAEKAMNKERGKKKEIHKRRRIKQQNNKYFNYVLLLL